MSETRAAEVRAKYAGRPCALCGIEAGEPLQLVPTRSFTENNVLAVGPACQLLLRQRVPAAVEAVRLIIHDDDARYALLADDLDTYYGLPYKKVT